MSSIAQKIKNRIKGKGRGWVFTPKDFVDLGSRSNVGTILQRLVLQGHIRQVSRGIYDYPRHHPVVGDVPASARQIADAVARTTGDHLRPTGAQAANQLGLTTQVPAKLAYVTTGKPKKIHLGKQVIDLQKNTLPKTLTHDMAYLALQALDDMGPRYVDGKMIDKCAKRLAPGDKKDIQQNLRYIRNPWLADIARQLIA
jgi:hypothetical protein